MTHHIESLRGVKRCKNGAGNWAILIKTVCDKKLLCEKRCSGRVARTKPMLMCGGREIICLKKDERAFLKLQQRGRVKRWTYKKWIIYGPFPVWVGGLSSKFLHLRYNIFRQRHIKMKG